MAERAVVAAGLSSEEIHALKVAVEIRLKYLSDILHVGSDGPGIKEQAQAQSDALVSGATKLGL